MSKKTRRKFDEVDRVKYHLDREYECGRYGLNYGEPKHSYSIGFSDGVSFIDNTAAMRGEFGAKSARAYASGRKRGQAAAKSYFKRTGQDLKDVKRTRFL